MTIWAELLRKFYKVLLALPIIDIFWCIYRLLLGIEHHSKLEVFIAIVLMIFGLPWLWLVDIIYIILYDRVIWFH